VIENLVGGDSVQPCVKFRLTSERWHCGPYLDQYVLQEIVGVLMAAKKTAHVPIESFRVGINNAIESLLLPSGGVQCYDFIVSHVL
jgi:hypothetical protein